MTKTLLFVALLALGLLTISTTDVISAIDLAPYHPEDPRSGGAAALLGQDRTGGPLAVGTCAACHSPTGSTTVISGVLKNEFGTSVTTYDAGEDYTMEFTVTNNLFNNFAFQANALTSTNNQGGDFTSPISPNTQVSNISGIQYPEHQGAKSGTGSTIFTVNWVAPVNGAGAIAIFGIGMAVNLNGGTSGDAPSAGGGSGPLFTLNESPATLVDYSSSSYCTSDASSNPLFSGNSTGTYSASPSGLSINSGTGEVNPSLSLPGNYTINYTYGSGAGGTVSTALEIIDSDAGFNYPSLSYCMNETDPEAIITGTGGGIFSGPAAVVFTNTLTGEIDLASSTPGGPYTITHTISGACPDAQTFDITINANEDASFVYDSDYCQSDANPIASAVATPGGTFSGPSPVIFANTSTGEIDIFNSASGGPYTISYTTPGATCPGTSTQEITINEDYNYSLSIDICEDGTYQFGPNLLDASDVGMHTELFVSSKGCDSTVFLSLGTTTVDTSVSVIGLTLNADVAGFSYQWVDCDNNNAVILGETNQTFAPSIDGSYAVLVTDANCSKLSSCYSVVVGSSIFESQFSNLTVYPNPTNGKFDINGLEKLVAIQDITLFDLSGKEIRSFESTSIDFDIKDIPKGVYQLVIKHENGLEKMKLVKD
jgi:hypothetical protein